MFAAPTPLVNVTFYGATRQTKGFGAETEWVSALFFEEAARPSSRSAHPLMTVKRLDAVSPDILSSWRDARVRLREVTDLLLLLLNHHHKTAGAGFQLSLQAFEAFDRIIHPETLIREDEFKSVIDAMAGAIPKTASPQLKDKSRRQSSMGMSRLCGTGSRICIPVSARNSAQTLLDLRKARWNL